MFVTLLYGILNCQTCEFTFARAGHPEPLLLDDQNKVVTTPSTDCMPIGLFDASTIDEQRITIPSGGTVLIFSDGLSETLDDNQDSPLLPELCSGILSGNGVSAQALCDQLWRTVGGASAISLIKDDFTVVAVKNLG